MVPFPFEWVQRMYGRGTRDGYRLTTSGVTASSLLRGLNRDALRIIAQPTNQSQHFVEGFVSTTPSAHKLTDFDFVVLDVETTGLETTDRVVEIAAVRMSSSGRVLSEFSALVKPGQVRVSQGASYVHELQDKDLQDAPTFAEVWPHLKLHLAGAIVVAHNAPFDIAFINRDLPVEGQEPYPVLDLLYASRTLLAARGYKLEYLLRNLRGNWPRGLHKAHADARAEAELLFTLLSHPQPLYWHGPTPPQRPRSGHWDEYSGPARWVGFRPPQIPSMSSAVGRNTKIRAPKFVPPEVLVRSAIRRRRFYAGNDRPETRAVFDLLLEHGAVEAKRLTPTSRYFVGVPENIPPEGLPAGVQLKTTTWMMDWIEKEVAAVREREEECIADLRAAHREEYANKRYYSVEWRQEALPPHRYIEEFPWLRWDH